MLTYANACSISRYCSTSKHSIHAANLKADGASVKVDILVPTVRYCSTSKHSIRAANLKADGTSVCVGGWETLRPYGVLRVLRFAVEGRRELARQPAYTSAYVSYACCYYLLVLHS
jgi:hypothetical protein